MLYATHIINRLPTRLLDWKSTFEVLFGKKPDYSFFQVFCCLCFAVNLNPSKSKLESKVHKCVFLSQASNHNRYQLFNLDSNTVFLSTDLNFYESTYPFATKSNQPDLDNFIESCSMNLETHPSPSNPNHSYYRPTRLTHKPPYKITYVLLIILIL